MVYSFVNAKRILFNKFLKIISMLLETIRHFRWKKL